MLDIFGPAGPFIHPDQIFLCKTRAILVAKGLLDMCNVFSQVISRNVIDSCYMPIYSLAIQRI